jgi:Tfp pilus assembly protein PilF
MRSTGFLIRLTAPLAVFAALIVVLGGSASDEAPAEAPSAAALKARGAAALARVQAGGGVALYARAERAYGQALESDPQDPEAAAGLASAAMGRHDFARGLRLARRARDLAPQSLEALPVLTDARVELGRYRAAAASVERLARLKPGVAAYARISYLRELQGDVRGAVRAMRLARGAAASNPPAIAFTSALLGELALDSGNYARAAREFNAALAAVPEHPAAREGLAHLLLARGRYAAAARAYRELARQGGADVAASLAAIESERGRERAARRYLAIARRRFAAELEAGMRLDAGAVLFAVDSGPARRAVVKGRDVWRRAPSVTSADAYAWALSAAGRDRRALELSRRALATGWHDPEMLYRAGVVSVRAGAAARGEGLLRQALRESPRFHGIDAPAARAILERRER